MGHRLNLLFAACLCLLYACNEAPTSEEAALLFPLRTSVTDLFNMIKSAAPGAVAARAQVKRANVQVGAMSFNTYYKYLRAHTDNATYYVGSLAFKNLREHLTAQEPEFARLAEHYSSVAAFRRQEQNNSEADITVQSLQKSVEAMHLVLYASSLDLADSSPSTCSAAPTPGWCGFWNPFSWFNSACTATAQKCAPATSAATGPTSAATGPTSGSGSGAGTSAGTTSAVTGGAGVKKGVVGVQGQICPGGLDVSDAKDCGKPTNGIQYQCSAKNHYCVIQPF